MDSVDEQIREPISSEKRSTQGAVDGAILFNSTINHALKEINYVLSKEQAGTFVAMSDV